MRNFISVTEFGQLHFQADTVARVALPVFDVVEIRDIDDGDYMLSDPELYAADLFIEEELV